MFLASCPGMGDRVSPPLGTCSSPHSIRGEDSAPCWRGAAMSVTLSYRSGAGRWQTGLTRFSWQRAPSLGSSEACGAPRPPGEGLCWPEPRAVLTPLGEASRTASVLAQSTRGMERGSTSPGEGRPLDTACFLSKPSRIRSVSSKRIGVLIELNKGLEWYQVGPGRQEESSASLSPGPQRAGS